MAQVQLGFHKNEKLLFGVRAVVRGHEYGHCKNVDWERQLLAEASTLLLKTVREVVRVLTVSL